MRLRMRLIGTRSSPSRARLRRRWSCGRDGALGAERRDGAALAAPPELARRSAAGRRSGWSPCARGGRARRSLVSRPPLPVAAIAAGSSCVLLDQAAHGGAERPTGASRRRGRRRPRAASAPAAARGAAGARRGARRGGGSRGAAGAAARPAPAARRRAPAPSLDARHDVADLHRRALLLQRCASTPARSARDLDARLVGLELEQHARRRATRLAVAA